MGLRSGLLRFAAGRPHVLMVPAPGGTAARLAVEVELARRRWPVASGPADADVLVVAGSPGPELQHVADGLWGQLAAPRARTHVAEPATAGAVLDEAAAELADPHRQGASRARDDGVLAPPESHGDQGEHADHDMHMAHGGHDRGGDPEGSQHAGHHMGHDMGGMEMPGGLAMADRADDRDGLKLDQLHVTLGPVLPDWPAGLVVRTALQGDVVQHAEVRVLGGGAGSAFWDEPWLVAAAGETVTRGMAARRHAGRELDGLARLLGVAGWSSAAGMARDLRAEVLGGTPGGVVRPALERFARRVTRSRTLRWLTSGVETGMGDVHGRLLDRIAGTLDAAARFDNTSPLARAEPRLSRTRPGDLPLLLAGLELAELRLVVASLDPDTDASVTAEVPGG